LLVVFWGETHRNHFAKLLLPSLLAPGNIPAIQHISGSKLVLCTTRQDWDELEKVPLFVELKKFIEPILLEISFPAPAANKYLHSAHAFKRAVERCWEEGAYASFLVPDLILSDGTLAHARDLAASGILATLAPALRYNMEGCLSALSARGILVDDRPIVASERDLAAIALENLHSEMRRLEWGSPYFCRHPTSVWWRLPDRIGILLHTTSWLMLLVNFHALQELNAASLNLTAHDDRFINDNFFRFLKTEQLHLITDSDNAFLMSLTSEAEFTYYPLQSLRLNRIPVLGRLIKLWSLQLYMASSVFDPFRRWAVTIPTYLHTGPLPSTVSAKQTQTIKLLHRAIKPLGRLLALYNAMQTQTSNETRFLDELANKFLDFSGIYEDGWIAESAVMRLAGSMQPVQFVIAGMMPWNPKTSGVSQLVVRVDGLEKARYFLVQGQFFIPMNLEPSEKPIRVEIHADGVMPLGSGDPRHVSVRLMRVGWDNIERAFPSEFTPAPETAAMVDAVGFWVDGWSARHSELTLASGSDGIVTLRGIIPNLGSLFSTKLTVTVNGTQVGTTDITTGGVTVRFPVPASARPRRIVLDFADGQSLLKPDDRIVSMLVHAISLSRNVP
jgi:hypothetical protein